MRTRRTHGTTPGLFWAVHEFSADTDGNLYTAEATLRGVTKYVKD